MKYDQFHTRSLISVMSAIWWLYACESMTITTSNNSSAGGEVAVAHGGSSAASGGNGATVSVGGAAVTRAATETTTAGSTSVGTSSGGTTSSPTAGAASTIPTSPGGGMATGGMASGGTQTGGAGGPVTGGAAATGGTSSVHAMAGTSTGGVGVGGTANGGTTSGVANGGSPPIAGAPGSAGTAGSAGAMPCTAVAALLHGTVEPLSGNLCRVTYDFSTQNQLLDWNIIDSTGTKLEIANQLMLVTYIQSPLNLAAVLFKLPLRATRVTFRGTVLEGDQHINVYLAVQWNGDWAPQFGYGCIHYYGGRMFTVAGGSIQTSDTTSLVMNQTYNVGISMTSTQIHWSTDNNAVTYDSVYLYQGKDRNLALGSWRSSVAFDDLVIEGEF